ncbi:Uncharacterised protein [Neisseria animaloris]|uniref:hypothetical protein n=1 Tax=Neisseria animaloris TaxID=326522 RepID=UPI000A190314|nr:hypothetical protein [Neisseria animaloris]OSI08051.1 hypothetical protein BWD08_05465 [Neisseria animaloris]VEH87507.1 Uncharacterised protein [Neisseria animaloris]
MNISNYAKEKLQSSLGKSEVSFKYEINDMPLSSYLYKKESSDKLFVILNGALDRNRTTALTYHRYSWHPLFDGSVLYIADPTLFKHSSISLAWYMGDKYTPLYPYLKDFILSVASGLNISTSKLVLYGSSGGGFSAIQLASFIASGALAVCINPQTNIIKYVETNRDPFLAQCFSASWNDHQELSKNHRFNAIENVKLNNTKILYIQNETDNFHVKHHFEPFITQLGITNWQKNFEIDEENQSRVQVLWYKHESGHAAEPKECMPEIMRAINYMIDKVK